MTGRAAGPAPSSERRRRHWLIPTLALLLGTSLALLLSECAVRVASRTDADGNVMLRSLWLRPHRLPVQRVRASVRELRSREDVCIVYDPATGWAPRPNGSCKDGLYRYDALGIRSDGERGAPSAVPPPGVRRIVVVGDSFTHGDEVPYEESWAHRLEARLDARGTPTQVVNLGVGGYGMDQALLRWRALGRSLNPDVVVLGFQIENAWRNLNLIRPLYFLGTGLPFSKPRFVLEGDALRLVNVPALPLEQVAPTLERLEDWELLEHEAFYDPEEHRDRLLYRSRLASLLVVGLERLRKPAEVENAGAYARGSEPAELVLRIVSRLAEEVRAAGGELLVVHLPRREDLTWLSTRDEPLVYGELLRRVGERHALVDPSAALLEGVAGAAGVEDLMGRGHYSALGNRRVAEALAASPLLRTRSHSM